MTIEELRLKILSKIAFLNSESKERKVIRKKKIEALEQVLKWTHE